MTTDVILVVHLGFEVDRRNYEDNYPERGWKELNQNADVDFHRHPSHPYWSLRSAFVPDEHTRGLLCEDQVDPKTQA